MRYKKKSCYKKLEVVVCKIEVPENVKVEKKIQEKVGVEEEKIKEITENIVKQIPTLIDKKIDLFSSKVNQNLNGI